MATGWTWEYVWNHMTLQRLDAMQRLWKKCPPPHVNLSMITALLKAFMGVKDEVQLPKGPAKMPEFVNLPEIEE